MKRNESCFSAPVLFKLTVKGAVRLLSLRWRNTHHRSVPAFARRICVFSAALAALTAGQATAQPPHIRGEKGQSPIEVSLDRYEKPHYWSAVGRIFSVERISKKAYSKRPKKIQLKGNEADVSALIQYIKLVSEESDYDLLPFLQIVKGSLLRVEIMHLCSQAKIPETCEDKALADLEAAIDEISRKTAERILYPARYHPFLNNLDSHFFQTVLEENLECGECGDRQSVAVRGASPTQYQQLLGKLKEQDKNCIEDILSDMTEWLDSQKFPKPCLKKENKNHSVCRNMKREIGVIQSRISDLMELAYGPEATAVTEAGSSCEECAGQGGDEDRLSPFQNLAGFLRDSGNCLDINPGEEKTVHPAESDANASPYVLKRDPDGGYSIDFPIEFSIDEDYDGPYPKEKAPDRYREIIQKCLKEAGEMMFGPKGERLTISISRPRSPKNQNGAKGQCPKGKTKARHIAIGSKDHRSDAYKYESDIDCEVITHEILHLTGLCDEYKEQARGFYMDPETENVVGASFGKNTIERANSVGYQFKPAYDCRVTTKNSIMSNPWERWNNVREGQNKSLLTPGQFQSILYGGCSEKNGLFNECSRLAYQSSQTDGEECFKTKRRCERENGMGYYGRQEEIALLQEEIEDLKSRRQNFLKLQEDYRNDTSAWMNRTLREEYEIIKSVQETLPRSSSERAEFREHIKHLLNRKNDRLVRRKIDEEKGLLDKTRKEIELANIQRRRNETESELKAATERLKTVQSWNDD